MKQKYIETYFINSYSKFVKQKIDELLNKPKHMMEVLSEIHKELYLLFSAHIPKLTYLEALKNILFTHNQLENLIKKQYQCKGQMQCQVYLKLLKIQLTFCINQSLVVQESILKSISILLRQLMLLIVLQGDSFKNFMNRLIHCLSGSQLYSASFIIFFKQVLDKSGISAQNYIEMLISQSMITNQSNHKENNNIFKTPDRSIKLNKGNDNTNSTLQAASQNIFNKKKSHNNGRTLYISHPLRYRQNIKQQRWIYEYVQDSIQ